MTDLVGQQLGNYRLIRLLGQGGFADVYLGEHVHLNTQAAIKVLRTKVTSDNATHFRTEAQIIAHLDHPHIIRVLEFGVSGGTPFLVMDYAVNGTLRQRHPKGSKLPLAFILPYVQQAADALQYAHNQKVIHRDLKPENMLLGKRGEVLLSDFGLALTTQSSRYNNTQDIVGTAAYMAPEQLQGRPGPASDQYALGIVVYEWLCGERPFQGSFMEIYSQQLNVPPPSLCARVPDIPPYVEKALFMALAKNPADRFQTVQAFANALTQASQAMDLSGRDITVRRPPSPTPLPGSQQAQPPFIPPVQPQPGIAAFPAGQATDPQQGGVAFSQAVTLPSPQPSSPRLPATPGSTPGRAPSSPDNQGQVPTRTRRGKRRRGTTLAALAAALLLVILFGVVAIPRLNIALSGARANQSPTASASHSPVSQQSAGGITATTNASTPGSFSTPAATATPSPGNNPPQAGQLLYQANWSQGLNGWLGSSQWKAISNGELGSDGSSRGANTNDEFIIWAPAHLTTVNYKIIAQIQFVRSTSDRGIVEFGVIARGNGNDKGYEAGLSAGSGGSFCDNSKQQAIISSIDDTNSPPNLGCFGVNDLVGQNYPIDTNFHTFEFDVTGNSLVLYIDNRLITQTTDNSYVDAGQVGLRDIEGDINVKSFVVSAL